MTEEGEIEAGIAALESQRGVLSDAVLAMALGPLQSRLDALRARQRHCIQAGQPVLPLATHLLQQGQRLLHLVLQPLGIADLAGSQPISAAPLSSAKPLAMVSGTAAAVDPVDGANAHHRQ